MFLKICGIKTLDELRIVEKYANATGVIVECESKRKIDLKTAENIITNSKIPVFTVSTSKNLEIWKSIIESTSKNSNFKPYVQIHSDLASKNVEHIKNEYDCFIMKSFKVSERSLNPEKDAEQLIDKIKEYNIDNIDKILLDTGKGCGKTHDHRVSEIISKKFDVVLAGGITFENVRKIVNSVKPVGIDVSSGVELNNRKNELLIKKICDNLI
ncbi:phosphoribosylanthranilate isomerase [Methanococcus voltae]|uniref:phosphoribosylanthranilate isomerase n=1 Tax=Methanococcus voltae TaxID=2188 RepID=UPI001AE21529|nr:phosphoribosylanthranilate isomerase [Methanococcus voltae]MBP2173189.1 phosphoribosylanthranilate isomerase [Methanococcus voltae]